MVSTAMAVTTDGAWPGAVPVGWSLKQLKWAVTFQRGHDLPTEDRQEGPVPVVTGAGITGWHNVAQAKGPGIVTGRYGTIGEFHLVEQDYWPLNTSLYSIDLHGNHAGFLRYMLEPLAPLFHLNAAKSAVPGIDRSDIHTIPVAVPPLATQRAIAAYLDRETERLDGLLAAKERVLGLVVEKRRALITRAVTRGLDPRAPLRDSGIPWLGKIPAHWETPPVYSRFEVQLGKMLDEKKIKGTHLAPYLRNVDVQWGTIKTTDLPEMDFDDDDRVKYSLRAGDILVCEGGEVGRCAIWDGEYDECYYQKALHRLRVVHGKDKARFFVLVMRTLVDAGVFSSQASASTIQHLPGEKLRVVRYPAPPLSEQRAIVAHISAQTAKLDALRSATERTIALLKERRTALIAAAVTGRLHIPEAV
jgi:type I restriction enzyme S subunit